MQVLNETGPVLLYDGVCNLCNAAVKWVLRHERNQQMRFAALQSDFGQAVLKENGLDLKQLDSMLVVDDGRVLMRSDAALRMAEIVGGPWRLARIFRIVPKVLRDWCYNFVAANRYNWFGKEESCLLPQPEWRDRFIDLQVGNRLASNRD